jgi:hypothetical protein
MANELVPYADVEKMAAAVAKSGLFGSKTPEHAMTLMLIAQAEGLHPMAAVQQFHIINGQPARKAWSMLERFQSAGGKVEWHERTDAKVSATFSHPQGGSVKIDWDHARAAKAQINNPMWKKYPRQMLTARVISEGVRTVFPGATGGFYAEEEVSDMRDVTPPKAPAKPAVSAAGTPHDAATGEVIEPDFPEHSLPPTQPELPADQPPQTDESKRAEEWANEAIRRINDADDLVAIDKFMEKHRARIGQVHAANPEAGMALVEAADIRKRQIELKVPA